MSYILNGTPTRGLKYFRDQLGRSGDNHFALALAILQDAKGNKQASLDLLAMVIELAGPAD